MTWVLPYHEGAVKALREAGVWKAEHEAHNQKLLKRQETLAEAWGAFLKANPPDDKAAFSKGWMAARTAALTKAGMDPCSDRARERCGSGQENADVHRRKDAAAAARSSSTTRTCKPARSTPRSRACAG